MCWDQVTGMKNRADKLFEKALATGDPHGANRLLQEFVRGYPLERLRLLLRSNNPEVVKTGVFIASELGRGACALVDEFAPLLRHKTHGVRFDVLDCVLLCATALHGEMIARAIDLINDRDASVRWKALGFISRTTKAQLRASLPFLGREMRPHIAWLASVKVRTWPTEVWSARTRVQERILRGLRDPDPLRRRVAAAAAARVARIHTAALSRAASSGDSDVASFAQSELRIMGARQL